MGACASSAAPIAPNTSAPTPPTTSNADGLPTFPNETEMLVMPFSAFVSQQRICKSIKAWREKALKEGALVDFGGTTGYDHCIFISHTWWDREFKDASNDPSNPYDRGAPDWQQGEHKDLKWRVVVAAVRTLCQQKGWAEAKVALWLDWQSIYQDDNEMKGKGVRSLIHWATRCDAMLVPTDEARVSARFPENIAGYGSRGWCRAEYFIFSLWSAIVGREGEVELYAASTDGELRRFKEVVFEGGAANDMPEQGDFSVEADRAVVKGLQDSMIRAFVPAVIRQKCEGKPKEVVLSSKMLLAEHVPVLVRQIEGGALAECTYLRLGANSIGDEGAKALAAVLPSMSELERLDLDRNSIGDEGKAALKAMERDGLRIFT